jgi:signal transduction histidine kinase
MTVSASAEFMGLCRAQLVLLSQGFGSTFGAVYLAEGWTEGRATRWLPLVVYPDLGDRDRVLAQSPIGSPPPRSSADWSVEPDWNSRSEGTPDRRDLRNGDGRLSDSDGRDESDVARLDSDIQRAIDDLQPRSSGSPNPWPNVSSAPDRARRNRPKPRPGDRPSSPRFDETTADGHQIVLPLQQDGQVLGVLISRRDRPWTSLDYAQLEQIAQSLSMGCLLDRRLNWVQDRYQRQELLQEQRQDILDNWIHQLRNPLMALRTFGKLILRRLQPEDPNRSTVESLIREGDRIESLLAQMSQTIDGWMDVFPDELRSEPPISVTPPQTPVLEARTPLLLPPASPFGDRLILTPCAVVPLLYPLIESLTILAEDNDQTLELCLSDSIGDHPALAEASALREVLGNLIENALKYSGAGRQVWVHVAIEADRQLIRVIDNGPGIPAADLGCIFDRHYRGIQAQGSKPGSGLGLAIAHDFVAQMDGELRVISPVDWIQVNCPSLDPGPGTCFEVSLGLA